MAARPCTLCQTTTNSCYKLCTICAVEHDECQQCRKKMNLGIERKTIDELVAMRAKEVAEIEKAKADYAAAIAPLSEAVAAFRKADEEAGEEFERAKASESDAYEKALQSWREVKDSGGDVTEAQKAVDAAAAALKVKNEAGRKLLSQRRAETDAIYGQARKAFEAAGQAFQSAHWKAERRLDASVGRVLGHISVELGYKAELERIERH